MVGQEILVLFILVRIQVLQPESFGCLAQLARASRLHREGQEFESLNIHHKQEKCAIWRIFIY